MNRLGQSKGVALVQRHAKRRVQQARRIIVGRKNIQQPGLGQRVGRHVAGMRAAAHDIWRAHQHAHTVLARRLRRIECGREFGNHAAKLVGF